jgi:1-acyl-sn-glycerol-3-phosphate acyltransferase
MGPSLYRLLIPLGRVLVWIFFRKVEVQGHEHVPLEGPVIIAANHPNMLMDALLLGTTQPRPLSFLAKATLFSSPLLGRFLAAAGGLPIYRRSDSPEETGKNVLTFGACYELLEKGGALAIFPEGISHDRQAVLPLKTGCARLVLESEGRNDFRLGVKIVPVGLYFSAPSIFRSDVLVVYGSLLDPAQYFDRYRSDPQQAVRELTAALGRSLRELTLHVPQSEDEPLLSALRQMFPAGHDMSSRLEVDQELVKAMKHFSVNDPVRYSRLRREVLRYSGLLDALDLEHSQLKRRYRLGTVLRYMGPRLVLGGLGLPVFLYGAVNNFLPYRTPGWLSRLVARHPVEVATIKFVSGLLSFPVFYSLQTWAVGHSAGLGLAIIYLISLPLTGLFALGYQERLSGFFEEVRLFLLHLLRRDEMSRLKKRREAITRELEICREEYLSL